MGATLLIRHLLTGLFAAKEMKETGYGEGEGVENNFLTKLNKSANSEERKQTKFEHVQLTLLWRIKQAECINSKM